MNVFARLIFITLFVFLPPFGKEVLTNRGASIDFGPIVLRSMNHRFLTDFFKEDTVKTERYLEKIKNDSLLMLVFIDIKNQELSILDFSDTFNVVLSTKISSGKTGYSTPCGEFKISKKRQSRLSKKYGGTMLYWNCLVPDESIAIHGLKDKWYEKKLGKPASHGCIRISNSVAQTFYDMVPIGTIVLIE